MVPTVVVGGAATPILDVSQLARALGLPEPETAASLEVAHGAAAILAAWVGHVERLEPRLLTKPTPSRGRSLTNLTVNAFHPFELLPASWRTGRFDWEPGRDDEREARLTAHGAVPAFARRVEGDWRGFVAETADDLARRDPVVATRWGDLAYSTLLASQRWHAAFHYRQVVEFLRSEGVALPDALNVAELEELPPAGSVS
jgi:hypothetical protein